MFIPDPNFFYPGSEFFPSRIRIFPSRIRIFPSQTPYKNLSILTRLFIPDPDPDFLPNPDPGVKKAPDPRSRIRIPLGTVSDTSSSFAIFYFVLQIPAPDKEPLTVLDVQKIGYILHGRTIREEKPRKKLRAVLQIFIG
jgi:hypothetical protein